MESRKITQKIDLTKLGFSTRVQVQSKEQMLSNLDNQYAKFRISTKTYRANRRDIKAAFGI